MTQPIKSVLFRYENQKLTVLEPNIQVEGYRVGEIKLYPEIAYKQPEDFYYSGQNHTFYKFSKQKFTWVKQNLEDIPIEIQAWCLATGKPMK